MGNKEIQMDYKYLSNGYREIHKVIEEAQRISEYEKIWWFQRRLLGFEKKVERQKRMLNVSYVNEDD